jgi:Glycosyltransferase sugar-binding region containing DXD motif
MRVSKRLWFPLVAAVIFSVTFFTFHSEVIENARNIFDSTPLSPRYRAEQYDFVPSPSEASCLAGDDAIDKPPIPNVVHYVIGLHDPELSYPAYLSIRSALESLNPDSLKLHHTGLLNFNNPYVQALLREPAVMTFQHDAEQLARKMYGSSHYAHWADIIRLEVILKEGGIYLDSDVFVLQPFDDIRHSSRDVVLGNEGGNRYGLCNAIIIARPNATFIHRWLDSYATWRSGEWNDHSVLLPKKMARANPGEVCELSPHAFFWPTATKRHVQWMHEPLDEEAFMDTLQRLEYNQGSLFDGQLAYHAWNQISWDPYLSMLDGVTVMDRDTRFNLMIRRFLT